MNDMKQFNLEEFLENPTRPIVTRDGRAVRIICTDRKNSHQHSIVALVQTDGTEQIYDYMTDGSYIANTQSLRDLFFALEEQKCPFKKGDRVLVRDSIYERWQARIFDEYNKDLKYQYWCEGDEDGYRQCIPYNEHTWQLLNTTDEYKEK